jgi:hypothetical protein
VDACEGASDAQRHALSTCEPAYPCDPACFLDVGWDPSSGTPDNGADASAGMGLGDAGF